MANGTGLRTSLVMQIRETKSPMRYAARSAIQSKATAIVYDTMKEAYKSTVMREAA
jgi:D-arabinose 1-dehydrogenase-like Zn-dependent alcohol dehydrogenase